MQYELQEIPHFYQLTERIGTAGQPQMEQFEAIAKDGYEVVINMSHKWNDPDALPMEEYAVHEAAEVRKQGMEYVFMPVQFFSPEQKDLDRFFEVMNVYKRRKIFVHCALNLRVSAFLHVYRVVVEGHDAAEEKERHVDPLWQQATGKLPEENETWDAFVKAAFERFEARRSA